MKTFRHFWVLTLGNLASILALRNTIESERHGIGVSANDILDKPAFILSLEEKEIELILASGADLGFRTEATKKQIYDRARKVGLGLCPAEAGPQLRRQYTDQPKGQWLLIAMEPIANSAGDPLIFSVRCYDSGSSWLEAYDGRDTYTWWPHDLWVFVLPKRSRRSV